MPQVLFQLVMVFILFQNIEGTIRHFNTKRFLDDDKWFQQNRYIVPRFDNNITVDKFPTILRARKQAVGGNPSSYSYNFIDDRRRFSSVIYSGEGGEVSYLICS